MLNLIRSLTAPLMSIALVMLSQGFFITFLSVRMNMDGYSTSIIGYVSSGYYAGLLVGAWFFEPLLYRIGHIRAFAAAAAFCTVTILFQSLILDPYFWIAMRFLAGICIACIFIVIESWLLARSTIDTRGRILSLYMIGLYASQSCGQFIINTVDLTTLSPFIVASWLCALSAIPLALTFTRSPETDQPSMTNIWKLFQSSPFGVIGCILAGMILSAIYTFVPIFAQEYQLSVAIVTSLTIAGGFLLQWPIGHLSDIFDRRRLLIMLSFATIIPSIGLIIFPQTALWVYTQSFLLGGLCFTIYPVSITHVCDRVQPEDIIKTTGVLMFAYSAGAVVGPSLAPVAITLMSILGLYLFIAICATTLGLVGLFSLFERPRVPMEEQTEYVSLPRMTPIAYELDPRILHEQEEQTAELR